MADAAYVDEAVQAAPKDYTLAASQELLLKSVRAVIDGTGATGAYLPAVQLVAPSGVVMFSAVPGEAVAAGASADVSWFPGGGVGDEQAAPAGVTRIQSPAGTLVVTAPTGPTASVDMPAVGVTPGTYGDASDVAQVTVDAEGRVTEAVGVPIAGGGTVVAADGWVPDSTETWTFASFTAGPPAVGTFTVPGDVRVKYSVGTRIKLAQPDVRYFVVSAAPTFDGTNTTVTVSGGTDYVLANAAISGNAHSYVANPQGWPEWFNFNPNPSGWAATPTVNLARFAVEGRVCVVAVDVTGTSNAVTTTLTAPLPSGANASTTGATTYLNENAGVVSTTPGRVELLAGTSSMAFGTTTSGSGWTASGTKRVGVTLVYEV